MNIDKFVDVIDDLHIIVKAALNGADPFHDITNPSGDMLEYFAHPIIESDYLNFTNCYIQFGKNYYADIYPHEIEITIDAITTIKIDPRPFVDISDEEIFMQSTMQDLSAFSSNIELLKDLITIAKIAEKHNGDRNL